ncbi:hypothetical protein SAMN05660841_04252 [Sphingobacterium nematocida]|uniref:Cytochrome c domain-containing protein n=1 Tax=Sphingobacterium nematocida TaxID=1513896 RepID=A0A1T5GPQ6_9SPHI|nr:hypothetical protein [Sphingobacterium nematocida]SKC10310.1 hypothetical protein SAMN05660841_04252 [Sphingobacterium nematocida]
MHKLNIYIACLMGILLMASCFPKASQAIRSLPVESKEQILSQYNPEQIAQGETLFANSCGNCHKLKQPETRTAEQWNKIVKRMIPKAKLSDDEGKLVRAYVIANAKTM